jgi:hypothetical protein
MLRILCALSLVWLWACARVAEAPAAVQEPAGSALAALQHPDFTWRTRTARGCRVHYEPDTFAARHIAALTRSAEGALDRARDMLGEPYDRIIDVFYIGSREEMQALMDVRATGFADWESSAVYLVCTEEWRSFDVHEITHIVSLTAWGRPVEPVWWIREGLAVAVDGRCLDLSVDAYAAEWLRRGELPSAEDLALRFHEQGELRGYLGSGSLVGFLAAEFGMDAVEEIWKRGAEDLPEVLGVGFQELDARWRETLRTVEERPSEAEWAIMLDAGCG